MLRLFSLIVLALTINFAPAASAQDKAEYIKMMEQRIQLEDTKEFFR